MYRALTYPGDVRELATRVEVPRPDAGVRRTVPVLLGADAFGAPYEVLDVEVHDDPPNGLYSVVHLGPSSADTRRGNRARYLDQRAELADQQREHARVAHFWRPDLWPPAVDDAKLAQAVRVLKAAAASAA